MTLLPADPTRRNAVLAVILALSSIYFARSYAYSPAAAAADAAHLRLSELRDWNLRTAQQVRSAAGLGQRLARYQARAALVKRLVAAEGELGGLLEAVSRAARTAGAEIASVRPGTHEADGFFELRNYDVQVAGSYHSIGRFVAAVASLERIVVPRVAAVVPADAPPGTDDRQVVAALELRIPVMANDADADDPDDADGADDPAGAAAP